MIRRPRDIQSGSDRKSVLAKLLATENITVEIRNVATAFFDIKSRLLVIPQLKSDLIPELYDMFIGHEVGHALYTPQNALNLAQTRKINHQIWNIVEDIRIEKLIKRQYPGLKRDFLIGYQDLLARNFFGIKGKDLATEINFLDRINLEAKCGSSLGIQYSPEEQQIVDSLQFLESHEDTLEACERIQDFLKKRREQKQTEKKESKPKLPENSTDSGGDSYGPQEGESSGPMDDDDLGDVDGDNQEESERESSENKSQEGSEGETSSKSASEDVPEESKDTKSSGGDIGGDGAGLNSEEESTTVQKLEEALKKLLDSSFSGKIRNLTIPTFNLENIIYPYSDCMQDLLNHIFRDDNHNPNWTTLNIKYNTYKESTKNIISYLVKEFELKKNAFEMQKTQITKTGILDSKKLSQFQLIEDIFKRNSYTPGGKSHGLVLFMDWSGSMAADMRHSIRQLFCLTDFCQKIKIPFEVYSFVSQSRPRVPNKNGTYTPKIGNLAPRPFSLWNILSSKMTNQEYIQMQKMVLHVVMENKYPIGFSLSGTPFNEAIIAAMQIVPQFKKAYKLQKVHTIFITDGEGHALLFYHMNGTKNIDCLDYCADKLYLYDAISGTQMQIVKRNVSGYQEMTNKLLQLLRNRTDSNVIGFFLTKRSQIPTWAKWFPDVNSIQSQTLDKEFTEKGFVEAKQSGYSSYFILNLVTMNLDSDPVFEWTPPSWLKKSDSTQHKMAVLNKEFTKFTKQIATNKILLTQFIKQIV